MTLAFRTLRTPPTLANPPCFGAFRQRRASSRLLCRSVTDQANAELLDRFWQARGVYDTEQRRRLVEAADDTSVGEWQWDGSGPLPGAGAAWFLDEDESTAPQVALVSQQLTQLQRLLGGQADIDVVNMLVREPRLISADLGRITRRLVDMKMASLGQSVDVVKVVEAQPSLLLQAEPERDDQETAADRVEAWKYGLVSDNASQWQQRYTDLVAYHHQHGDAHVGYRDDDDAELARWANKQRAAYKEGSLSMERQEQLARLDFQFDSEAAEWWRWFKQLQSFRQQHGHCDVTPLAAGADFLLLNWCSVQRIANRSRVLREERVAMLDSIDFDWTGADALS
ncbi:hypothetical protein WJX72_001950 [[Myrmecia] bisecta]|uniref:Helicase-associated domain-containing protein n=1 Tax=[Myrmecia] bisecta TaxID=41462 RepID=A0AAW1PSI2_9CHLO